MQTSFGFRVDICKVRLMHKDENDLKCYEEHFGCQVELGHHQNEILFDKGITELVQPRKDPAFSQHCLAKCKKILGRFRQRSEFVSQIHEIILAQPGYFPTATEVAQTLESSRIYDTQRVLSSPWRIQIDSLLVCICNCLPL